MSRRRTIMSICVAVLLGASAWAMSWPHRGELQGLLYTLPFSLWFTLPAVLMLMSPLRLLPLATAYVLICIWGPADGFLGLLIVVTITSFATAALLSRLAFVTLDALRSRRL